MARITSKKIQADQVTAELIRAREVWQTPQYRQELSFSGSLAYATHSTWTQASFGDRLYFEFIADDPGNGGQV